MSPPITTFTHTGIALGTSNTTLIAANSGRYYLLILNMGASAIHIRLDGGVSVADKTALRLLPGQSYEPLNYVPGSAITGISASGTNDVHIVEGAAP